MRVPRIFFFFGLIFHAALTLLEEAAIWLWKFSNR